MFKKWCIIIFISLLTGCSCQAQDSIRPLKVGDACPDLRLQPIINYGRAAARVSDFRGQLLLLDFGSTNCIPCIKLLPELDHLQRVFKDSLQVFMVTPEQSDQVAAFLKRTKFLQGIQVPVITEDTLLSQYFSYQSIPHEVWIDAQGRVAAITDHEYVKEENIRALLQRQPVDWAVKRQVVYDYNQPLLSRNKSVTEIAGTSAVIHYSALTGYLDGISSRRVVKRDSIQDYYRETIFNASLLELYLTAWRQGWSTFPRSQIHIRVKNPSRVRYKEGADYKSQWMQKYAYCYEAVLPLSMPDSGKARMIQRDLDSRLGLRGRMEKRKVKSLVIKQKRPAPAGTGKGIQVTMEDMIKMPEKNWQQQMNLSSLLWRLENLEGGMPVIDETNLSAEGKSAYSFIIREADLGDRQQLRRLLRQQGLALQIRKRMVDLFILTD